MFSQNQIFTYIVRALVLLTCIPVHEAAHAYVSWKLGDPTAKNLGRMTLNPLVHLDPMGSVLMILTGFGWAKPVPIVARNFTNIKKGMAISALAGPVANVLLALLLTNVYKLLYVFVGVSSNAMATVLNILYIMIQLNCGLAVFNLIPIPPLDGSRLVTALLPSRIYFKVMQYERYIMIGLFVLLFTGILNRPIGFLRSALLTALDAVTSFIR